jgi:hypothetical protein
LSVTVVLLFFYRRDSSPKRAVRHFDDARVSEKSSTSRHGIGRCASLEAWDDVQSHWHARLNQTRRGRHKSSPEQRLQSTEVCACVSKEQSCQHLFGQDQPSIGSDTQTVFGAIVLENGFAASMQKLGHDVTDRGSFERLCRFLDFFDLAQ